MKQDKADTTVPADVERSLSPTQEQGPTVHDVTVQICQACIDLVGEECHTPECVFFLHGMAEVKYLLDKMLICPIVDNERFVLAGDAAIAELEREERPAPVS